MEEHPCLVGYFYYFNKPWKYGIAMSFTDMKTHPYTATGKRTTGNEVSFNREGVGRPDVSVRQ